MTTAVAVAGQIVGGYRLIAPIGGGGMGTIWRAEHAVLGRVVAIKLLLPTLSHDPAMVERFFDEARAATRIADPGIVTVHDFGWHDDGEAYLVMEHLVGESLADRLARCGRVPVDEAMRIVRLAALAMAAAHAAAIVHRDLKPDNIYLVADPAVVGGERVKILDFGIAKLLGEGPHAAALTQTGAILGTPTYMSPEQCRNAGTVDHRTDVYSLGCVFFHLLTGQPPFATTSTADVIASHLLEPPRRPGQLVPDVPPAIDALVLRCLAKVIDERVASMIELAHALEIPAPHTPARPSSQPRSVAPDVGLLSTLAVGAATTTDAPRRRSARLAIAMAATGLATFAIVAGLRARSRSTTIPVVTPTDESRSSRGAASAAGPIDAGSADAEAIETGADAASPIDAGIDGRAAAARRRYDPYAAR